jgi:hypothetical protein
MLELFLFQHQENYSTEHTSTYIQTVMMNNNKDRILGSHGGEYEDGCLLGCSAV